jgi:uncharacterized protein (DUF983 family)
MRHDMMLGRPPLADQAFLEGHVPDHNPARWEPERALPAPSWPVPDYPTALWRGLVNRCPACGQTHLFAGFLRVAPECRNCGAPLGLLRADDAPPYFTIFITGHVVVPLLFMMDRRNASLWLEAAIFLPLTLVMALALIRPVKGATVGLMLKLNLFKAADE